MPQARIGTTELVLFELAGWSYGIAAAAVVELVRAATIVPLPGAPAIVEGVINLRRRLIPVLDIRARFNLAPHPLALSDRFIIAEAGGRIVALRVDHVSAVVRFDAADIESAEALIPGAGYLAGVARLADGLVLIHDLCSFLKPAEEDALAALALEEVPA